VITVLAVLMSLWAASVPVPVGRFADMLGYLAFNADGWLELLRLREWREWESPYTRFLYGAALWAMVLACWITRRVARGAVVKRVSKQRAAPFAYWRRWLVTPVLFGLTTWACTTLLPVYAGFWVSKPWLDRAVVDADADSTGGLPPRWMGVFGPYPRTTGVKTGRAWLQVHTNDQGTGVELWEGVGFIHGTKGAPSVPPGWRVRRLSNQWFLVERDGMSD
jgi:hypothetical protein